MIQNPINKSKLWYKTHKLKILAWHLHPLSLYVCLVQISCKNQEVEWGIICSFLDFFHNVFLVGKTKFYLIWNLVSTLPQDTKSTLSLTRDNQRSSWSYIMSLAFTANEVDKLYALDILKLWYAIQVVVQLLLSSAVSYFIYLSDHRKIILKLKVIIMNLQERLFTKACVAKLMPLKYVTTRLSL